MARQAPRNPHIVPGNLPIVLRKSSYCTKKILILYRERQIEINLCQKKVKLIFHKFLSSKKCSIEFRIKKHLFQVTKEKMIFMAKMLIFGVKHCFVAKRNTFRAKIFSFFGAKHRPPDATRLSDVRMAHRPPWPPVAHGVSSCFCSSLRGLFELHTPLGEASTWPQRSVEIRLRQ